MRQLVLDTETTGLDPEQGHRIIEIGCVEYINRKPTGQTWHRYINPERQIDEGALAVHGISTEFLADKPFFADITDEFLDFVDDAELVIHNAPFDVGFLDAELRRLKKRYALMGARCSILDTLVLARKLHPGQRNSLDALCKRYDIDNSSRTLHGALLDAQILGDVYLAMTGGQATLFVATDDAQSQSEHVTQRRPVDRAGLELVVLKAQPDELDAHQQKLDQIEKASGQTSVWRELDNLVE